MGGPLQKDLVDAVPPPPQQRLQANLVARMIVCSCTGVTDRDIRQAIAWMRAADPYTLITPGKIYRALGKAADCGGCIRLFVEQMRKDDNFAVPVELQNLRPRRERRREEPLG